MGVTVRIARDEDAEAIAAAHVETWRHAYAGLLPQEVLDGLSRRRQTRRWRRAIRNPDEELGQVFVAEAHGIAGFGSASRGTGEITTLYVRPGAQRRGIGRLLFRRMAQFLEGPVALWVLDGNPAASFYARLGGRPGVHATVERWGLELGRTRYCWPDAFARPCADGPE